MPNQGSSQQPAAWKSRLGLIVLGLLLAAAMTVYSTLHFGVVDGEEFSPQTFTRRSFIYYEIPLVGLQVSPVSRSDETGKLEDFLTTEKIVIAAKGREPRWDLVIARRGGMVSSFGEAQILCNYLDADDAEEKQVWLDWSRKHKELAKVLWPVVAKLARQELYVFVPDLLALASSATLPDQLDKALDQALAAKYLDLAGNRQALGRHEQAIELYTEALVHAPQHIEALQGRAKSLASVGSDEKAAADLAQARKIQERF